MTALPAPRSLASHREVVRQMASFGAIGVASTLAYVALFTLLRGATSAGIANALALVITALGNTAANRWLTFGVRGRDGLARDHAAGLLAFAAALAVTSVSLVILNAVAPSHGRLSEVAVLVAANAAATLLRFVLLRLALDRPADRVPADRAPAGRSPILPATATLSQSERTRG
jgi:putative flippase GtrA